MNNNINHSELLKATKKAVNSFVFNPSASKKQSTLEALASLSAFIEAIETPSESETKPKASKSKKKPKASKAKPKASKGESKTASKSSRKAEIEAILTSGKKLKRSERSVLNKELHRLLQEEKAALKPSKKAKKSSKKTVRRPKRTSANGLEQAQAKQNTANKVGKTVKTKVVNAVDGGEAQPFEPRKEVQVVEPKVRKKAKMKLTLLPGESPEEAMARHRSAVLERERLEALALIAESNPMLEPSFAPAV